MATILGMIYQLLLNVVANVIAALIYNRFLK